MAYAAERPQVNRVATKTTTYPMTDDDAVILADATGGAFTVTTPDAASVKTGVIYSVVKIDSSANAITVDGSGAQTINGAATVSLSVQYQSITIASNGSNWFEVSTVGLNAPMGADYLVGTADAGLSAEIVVGTSPGGELGGTWASPTVDATHSGSAHHTRGHVVLDGGTDHTDSNAGTPTKGSMIAGTGSKWDDLVVGTDTDVLLSDSSQTLGVKWTAQGSAPWIQKSLFDAQGDLLTASADNTPAKLAAPTTLGQVLTYLTAANHLAWAAMPAFVGSGRSSNITSVAGTVYIGAFLNTATTEANANTLCPVACRMYNLYVYATSNTFDGTAVCTLRKNGAGTALTVTITAGSTATFSDTSNSVQYAAGDKFCLEVVENATTGTMNIVWVVAQRPDVA